MKILIAGDYCPQGRVGKLIDCGDYISVFDGVKHIIETADFSIVNFETCVGDVNDKPIHKSGPNLKSNASAIDALNFAGFTAVTLANNHFRDYGDSAVARTLNFLDKKSIRHVGGGNDVFEASKVLYVKCKDITTAIINACENEWSIASDNHGGSNPLNPIHQYNAIKEACGIADYVIVIIHGGHEHYPLPSPRMQETYRFFIDAGADAVINHHQHCYSGYEIYKGKPIFYGLGNFCFDKFNDRLPETWHEGYMVEFDAPPSPIGERKASMLTFHLIPYLQCKNKPSIKLMEREDLQKFQNKIDELNKIIQSSEDLRKHHQEWMVKNEKGMELMFTPWNNRFTKAAYIRGVLPSMINKEKLLLIKNCIRCESHYDRVMATLDKLTK